MFSKKVKGSSSIEGTYMKKIDPIHKRTYTYSLSKQKALVSLSDSLSLDVLMAPRATFHHAAFGVV